MRSLFSHILIFTLLTTAVPLRASGDNEEPGNTVEPAASRALNQPIPAHIHFKWNEEGRTIWEMFGVAPGELEDDVQDRKRDLIKGGSPESIVNEAWPLMKQDGFSKFYAGFVLAFGGSEAFKPGQGAVHILLFNAYYTRYKVQPISLLWNVSEKLEKLAEMLEESDQFAEIYGKSETQTIKDYAQKLRENRAIELRQSARRPWFQGETWSLAGKSKWLAAAAGVCALTLFAYHRGAVDYAPRPADVIQQRDTPLPAATDVRNPAQTQRVQKAADEAAIKRGEEARKLFDME